jgi:multidrug efflux pump
MSISDLSLRRPVFATVCSILIIFFGLIGFGSLGVREYPAIDPPNITVRTFYTGANAEVIESQITEPLERSINGIAGIRTISSQSTLGSSTITVEFDLNEDLEAAANDVRDKVSQAVRNLPQDIDAPPTVQKADASGDPILFVPIQSSTRNLVDLSLYAENVVADKIRTIPGVSTVNLFGLKRPAMRLWMDPAKLTAYGLTPQDVLTALNRENVELPGGKLRGNTTELTIKTFGQLRTESDFNDMIIRANPQGGVVRFRDVGEAVLGPESEEGTARRNNFYNISLAVIPQPGANYIAITTEFYKRLDQIKKDLPPDIVIDTGLDKSKFVRRAVNEVGETLLFAIALVVLIIYLFFRNWAIALRPLLDIPVSLIGAFFVMYVFGFSINVLTLLGIVLATGLVVDDGIVVTENIFKKMEAGMDKWTAAREGTREIFFAVISTSITLAVVFIPVVFLEGFTGRLFREFGIVVASAVLISAFVSLTLTPVLNVKLGGSTTHGWFYHKTEPFYVWLDQSYGSALRRFMQYRWVALVLTGLCFYAIRYLSGQLKTELAPLEDRNIVRANVTAPEGTDFDRTEKIIYDVAQKAIDSISESSMVFGIAAPNFAGPGSSNTGFISVLLPSPEDRSRSQMQIYNQMTRMYKGYTEARVFPNQEQTITTSLAGGFGLPVQVVLQNFDFNKLQEALPKILDEARRDPTFANVDANLKFNKPEIQVEVDRLRAAELGVSVLDVSQTLQLALSGRRFGYFQMDGKQYQVIGQVDRAERDEPTDLAGLYVRNRSGQLVQLSNLVKFNETSNPPTLFRWNGYKSATISAALAPGKTLGEGVYNLENIARKHMDASFSMDLSGPSRDFRESQGNTSTAFFLALVLIYLILAAQFESFLDPLIIMFTVPLALAGAYLSLYLMGHTLNIFSQIGMIMLIGLVTKNGILIVEFANQKRDAGMERNQAVIAAAQARLRPILMTTLATVLGALPIALALGAAATSRIPLGVVVVGGLLFSLVLTLFVIPAIYGLFTFKRRRYKYKEPQ